MKRTNATRKTVSLGNYFKEIAEMEEKKNTIKIENRRYRAATAIAIIALLVTMLSLLIQILNLI